MFNDFLSSLLKIVIVVDIVGVVAYFVLTALKPRHGEGTPHSSAPVTESTTPRWHGWPQVAALQRLRAGFGRFSPSQPRHVRASTSEGLEASFARLHRVLNSYQEGLA